MALFFLLSARVAEAQQAPSVADRETARTHMSDGDSAFAAKRYADALRAYREADALVRVPTTSAEVAKAHEALGELLEAKEACRRVLTYPQQPSEPPPFTSARRGCEKLSQSLAERIPSVTVRFTGLASGVAPQMTIDGESALVTSLEVKRRVNPGTHRIVAIAPGYAEATRSFTVAERANEPVEVAMSPSEGAAALDMPAHAAAKPQSLVSAPASTPRGTSMPLYAKVGFGVGAAGVVVGSILGLMTISRVQKAKKLCVDDICDPAATDDVDASKTLSHVSTAGFAFGIVGAGVGVYGLLAGGPAAEHAKVRPYFTGTGGGLAGQF